MSTTPESALPETPSRRRPWSRRRKVLTLLGVLLVLLLIPTAPALPAATGHHPADTGPLSGAERRAFLLFAGVLILGGAFLLVKGAMEIRELITGGEDEDPRTTKSAQVFWMVIVQIAIIDIVFSLDSVITAVGLVQHVPVMVAAIVISVGVMMLSAGTIRT